MQGVSSFSSVRHHHTTPFCNHVSCHRGFRQAHPITELAANEVQELLNGKAAKSERRNTQILLSSPDKTRTCLYRSRHQWLQTHHSTTDQRPEVTN